MGWDAIVNRVSPYVVRIETPDGHGTGFVCLYNHDRTWIGIATAAHVVSRTDEWVQPVRVISHARERVELFSPPERVIFVNGLNDSAVVLIPNRFSFDKDLIPLLPATTDVPIGTSIGWLGYPWIASDTMCFFCGTVSAIQRVSGLAHGRSYLVDGVAINGVSGGPVIYHNIQDDTIFIVGILTAYMANRQRGEALPGLSVAQDVSHFHSVLDTVRNIDEAEQKKREMEASNPPRPPSEPPPIAS